MNRYQFLYTKTLNDVMVSVFFDKELGVYTAKAVNLNDLEFLGGHSSPDGAFEDAVREEGNKDD